MKIVDSHAHYGQCHVFGQTNTADALPALCIRPARKYPDLPIILAHAGAGLFSGEAIIAAEVCPNIFLETSWVFSEFMPEMASVAGGRMLFGSDLLNNIKTELAKLDSTEMADSLRHDLMHGTAERLFRLT